MTTLCLNQPKLHLPTLEGVVGSKNNSLLPPSPSPPIFHSLDLQHNSNLFSFKQSNSSFGLDIRDSASDIVCSGQSTFLSNSCVDDSATLPLSIKIRPIADGKKTLTAKYTCCPTENVFAERKPGYGDCGCITSEELVQELSPESETKLILLDVRENRFFHTSHIRGARHANCHTKLMVKRAIANWNAWYPAIDAKPAGQTPSGLEVVVYDQRSQSPNANKPLNMFLEHILHTGNTIRFLEAGFENFSRVAPKHLIGSNLSDDSIRQYSFSPTSPECPSEDVLNATASQILPFLYLGNERDTHDVDLLNQLGITHILNMTEHIPFHLEYLNKFVYKRCPASDCQKQDLRKFFPEAINFIESAHLSGGRVLVHCWAGVSRSASIVMAYLLHATRLPLVRILEYTRQKRAIVAPNFSFMGQLERYCQSLEETILDRALREHINEYLNVKLSASSVIDTEMDCDSPLVTGAQPFLK